MSVEEITSILALEASSVGAFSTLDLAEGDVEVSGGSFGLLVTFPGKRHPLGDLHARLHVDRYIGLLSFDGPTVKSEGLLLVGDSFFGAVIHLFKRHVNGNIDVLGRLRHGFAEATVSRAEVTALDLLISPRNFREVRAQIVERVRLEEELVEDRVAVLLVLITTTVDAIRALDTEAEALVTILFINCSQLHAGEHLVSLADHVELGEVEAHLRRVLERMILQRIFLESRQSGYEGETVCIIYLRRVDFKLISTPFQFQNGEIVLLSGHLFD